MNNSSFLSLQIGSYRKKACIQLITRSHPNISPLAHLLHFMGQDGCFMKKLLIPIIAILFFSVVSALAQPWGRGMGRGYGSVPHTESGLNLTQEQSDQLHKMRESYVKEITHLQNRLFSKQAEIRFLWKEPDPDREKILTKESESSRIQGELGEKAIQFQLDCRSILTEEQKAKLTSGGAGMSGGYGPGWQRR